MTTVEEMKKQIDSMTYDDLLRRWRHAPVGDQMFVGEVGVYYSKAMAAKRAALPPGAHSAASKRIGWGD